LSKNEPKKDSFPLGAYPTLKANPHQKNPIAWIFFPAIAPARPALLKNLLGDLSRKGPRFLLMLHALDGNDCHFSVKGLS